MHLLLAAATIGLVLCAYCNQASAQGTSSTHDDLLGHSSERRIERQGQVTEAEGGPTTPTAVGEKALESPHLAQPEPFGANLFRGAAPAVSDAANPNYLVQPGDRIDVRIWAALRRRLPASSTPMAICSFQTSAPFMSRVSGPVTCSQASKANSAGSIRRTFKSMLCSSLRTASASSLPALSTDRGAIRGCKRFSAGFSCASRGYRPSARQLS